MSTKTRAQIGYEAYKTSTGGKTFDGRDMPTWAEIEEKSPHVAKAWGAASAAIIDSFLGLTDEDVPPTAPEGASNR